MRTEKLLHRAGIVTRPCFGVVRIDREIAGVVNVRLEFRFAPAVESISEQEAAVLAAAIIDRYAR